MYILLYLQSNPQCTKNLSQTKTRHPRNQILTMFDGLPDVIASSKASLPIHLHENPHRPFSFHDPYQELIPDAGKDVDRNHLFPTPPSLAMEEDQMRLTNVPWSSNEVGALLKLRSDMGVSFPSDFTWEHISRKLGEMGFKRSPEECRRKYAEEEETQKIFTELDELYPDTMKKKREEEQFELLKGLAEGIVGKMIEQQEEMHKKLIEDIVRRDKEKVEHELAWRKHEMERIQTEIDMRAKQRASAGARQATMIDFLIKAAVQLPDHHQNPNSPISVKRWSKDEILALINLRCKIHSSDNKGPLWERISASMVKLGYRRSAKRCKEKWENINKYFRKTRDSKKKRSVDSRTCPYFHQLTCLYSTQRTQQLSNSYTYI